MDLSWLIWPFVLAQFFVPLYQKQMLALRRNRSFHAFEQRRKTRLITMIHRQETMSFLGFSLARYIDIEDSEQVLRAVRLTPEQTSQRRPSVEFIPLPYTAPQPAVRPRGDRSSG